MPGTAAGTARRRHAPWRRRPRRHSPVWGTPSRGAPCWASGASLPAPRAACTADRTAARRTSSVTSLQRSSVCVPSMSTSGSTMGTSPASWHSAAYRARDCVFASMQPRLGMPSATVMTARHLAKRAPICAYSARRVSQPVETFGDPLSRMTGHALRACVDLDARNHPRVGDGFRKWSAGLRALADRLVVEDRPADVLAEAGGAHEPVAVGAPRVRGLRDPERRKARVARWIALVHREEASASGDQHPGHVRERLRAHVCSAPYTLFAPAAEVRAPA